MNIMTLNKSDGTTQEVELIAKFKLDKFDEDEFFKSKIELAAKDEVNNILGMPEYVEKRDLYIGKSPIYDDIKIR